ncbi:MAG: bacillithiol biosynthesis BshC [Planctomycetes bacterium]|nr:bacillithiol biosynthesis BshC [Planctomycetota bacterium]
MSYRVRKLPLTTTRDAHSRAHTLARLSRRRGKLPKSAYTNFQVMARRLGRHPFKLDPAIEEAQLEWLKRINRARRYNDAMRTLTRGEGFAVVVPVMKGVAAPRLDEVLRLLAGLELARQLRNRRVGKVVTLIWPCLDIGEWDETGMSAIMQRNGELDDIGFRGGDLSRYLQMLRGSLPGTGFSSLLMDQLSRDADEDPNVFKARLLLRWFDDEAVTYLAPTTDGNFETNLRQWFRRIPMVACVGTGSPTGGLPPGEPVPFPGVSATIIEGKVEGWLSKFALQPEEVLAGEARPDTASRRHLPEDSAVVVNAAKESVLGAMLRLEMGLEDLGFKPESEVKKALTSTDIGFDKLRQRAATETAREVDVNGKQLGKLFQYMLPDGRPQQEVMSLLHYLDFYGPDFLEGLRDVLQFDDVRHQAVYLAEEEA